MKASDVEYVTDNYGVTNDKTASWLKVKGTGEFKVNLKTAEFLIDNARNSVTVRISKPKLEVKYGMLFKIILRASQISDFHSYIPKEQSTQIMRQLLF